MAQVYDLCFHLRKCPPIFLQDSLLQNEDGIDTSAILTDLFRSVSGRFLEVDFNLPKRRQLENQKANYLKSLHIACWLFSHPYFIGRNSLVPKIHEFLFNDLKPICDIVEFEKWIEDEERTEEMVRTGLFVCEIQPTGESIDEAIDKLSAISTIDRQEILKKSSQAMKRMMEIRKKMAEKKAQEAANPYGRE